MCSDGWCGIGLLVDSGLGAIVVDVVISTLAARLAVNTTCGLAKSSMVFVLVGPITCLSLCRNVKKTVVSTEERKGVYGRKYNYFSRFVKKNDEKVGRLANKV